MSGHFPPLTCTEVKRILRTLGFEPRKGGSGSREQWVKDENGRRYKVTVDCPQGAFLSNPHRVEGASSGHLQEGVLCRARAITAITNAVGEVELNPAV